MSDILKGAQILVVDDEVAMVRSLELLLRPLGMIHKAYSVPEVEELFSKNQKIDCIVTDVAMPEASGLTLLEQVRRRYPEIPVIVMTAYSSISQAVEAMQKGAFEYVVKPFENSELVALVKKALLKKGIHEGETKNIPTGWVCNSPAMNDFLVKAEKMAKHSSPLLILGETGVGKRRGARWIHDEGLSANLEFLSIDGRSHEEDSPLLHKNLNRVGTLFVSEIFSLSSRLQDCLFNIIQEGKIRVLGSSSSSPELQSLPNFRKDLFEILTALTLKVPSLKERGADFEGLIREILITIGEKIQIKDLALEDNAFTKIKNYSFPGNVAELEKILECAALESKSNVLTEEVIHFSVSEDLKTLLPFSIPLEGGWNRLTLLKESLEQELIIRALKKHPQLSNAQIATLLGTTRRILELRMHAYNIREI